MSESGLYSYMRDYSYNMDFYPYSNQTLANPYCEWRVIPNIHKTVVLTINKDQENFEEFYMFVNSATGQNHYYAKDFTGCSSNLVTLEFSGMTYFRLKSMMLNENSNFTVNAFQDYYDEYKWAGVVLAVCGMLMIFLLATIAFVCFMRWMNIRRQRCMYIGQGGRPSQAQVDRVDFIQRCLDNMRKGKYSDMRIHYTQDACVVCLEEFEADSEIVITNECNHAFDFACLKKWFYNIPCRRDLTCPHCTCKITDQSKPQTELEDISHVSIDGTPNEKSKPENDSKETRNHLRLPSINRANPNSNDTNFDSRMDTHREIHNVMSSIESDKDEAIDDAGGHMRVHPISNANNIMIIGDIDETPFEEEKHQVRVFHGDVSIDEM